MTPEEYERLKNAEKEHLKKLKELKQAVRVLERQKKIQSELDKMTRASADALQEQADAVERLALETAHHEARLDVAVDSSDASRAGASDESLEDELRSARAQALVERLKHSMSDDEPESNSRVETGATEPARPTAATSSGTPLGHESQRSQSASFEKEVHTKEHPARSETSREDAENPTQEARPEKTIGRM